MARHGSKNSNWKGGRSDNARYPTVMCRDHPRANKGGHVGEHILVAERALGRYLPDGAEVHHVNGDTRDKRPQNLVICQDKAYHTLLHRRQRALDGCGHADWLHCVYCGELDDPKNLRVGKTKQGWSRAYHRPCAAAYERERRKRRKENEQQR